MTLVSGAFVTASVACAPERVLVGAGGECFTASDCEPGLVCIPQRSGARVCSADLAQVAGRPPAMGREDAATAEDAETDAPQPDEDSGQGQPDTGVVDTGAPPVDSGSD